MATPNLNLPELVQGQSSKEITHNLALRIIDVLVPIPIVQDKDLITPPSHIAGNMYIVASGATGAWTGQANKLAYSDGSSWYFITPKNKWPAFIVDEAKFYRFNGGSWVLETIGDVIGSNSSTDNAWARFDGTTGKLLQNGTWIENDAGDVTAGGLLNMVDKILQRPVIKDYAEELFSLGNIAGAVDVDFEKGNFQYGTLIGNITLTISNPPATGKVGSMTLELIQDATGNRTVTFPSSFKYAGGTAPILSTAPNAKDILVFFTRDGGNTYNVGLFWEGLYMMGFRVMLASNNSGNSGRMYNFNFTEASYTPPTDTLIIDFDPFGKPNFNFKIAGNTPPSGNSVNFNFS